MLWRVGDCSVCSAWGVIVIARIVFLDEKMDAKYAYVQQLAECNVAYAQPNVSLKFCKIYLCQNFMNWNHPKMNESLF